MITLPQHPVKTSPRRPKAILRLPCRGMTPACRSRYRQHYVRPLKRSGRLKDRYEGSVRVTPNCELTNGRLSHLWRDKEVAQ